jgi:hypothetical protein
MPVAETVRRLMPAATILICADNDAWTDKPMKNPGVWRAREAAEKVGGLVVVPQFTDLSTKPTDFNDLAVLEGLGEVSRQVRAGLERLRLAAPHSYHRASKKSANSLLDAMRLGGAMSASCDNRTTDNEPVELPPFEPPHMSAVTAGKRLERAVRGFLQRVVQYRRAVLWKQERAAALVEEAIAECVELSEAARKNITFRLRRQAAREAKKKFGKSTRPPRYQVAGAAGLGKTQGLVRGYWANPDLWEYHIEFYVPNVKLAQAVVNSFNTDAPPGMPPALLLQGRTKGDESTPAPCQRADIVAKVEGRVPSVYKAMCKNSKGDTCEFLQSCRYIQDRTDRSPRVRVMAHAAMTTPQVGELSLPKPDLVIVDESCIHSLVRKTNADLEQFSLIETYYRPDAPDDVNACAEGHASLGKELADLFQRLDYLKALRDRNSQELNEQLRRGGLDSLQEKNPKHLVNRLRAAAAAARRPLPLAVRPGDTDEVVEAKFADAPESGAMGVAAAFSRVADDLDQGRIESIGLRPCLTNEEGSDSQRFTPHVEVYGLKGRNFSNRTPLLLLDADAITEVNQIIFGHSKSAPLKALAFRARRQIEVIQCDSSVFSKRGFGIKGRHCTRRGSELADQIKDLMAEQAKAGEVLTVTNKQVRPLLTGERGKELALFGSLGPKVQVTHFGRFIGQDIWKHFPTAIIVGREQPPAAAIEVLARSIHADSDEPLNLTGSYSRGRRRYGPGEVWSAPFDYHPDRRIQPLLELIRERQIVQAVDRLRLVHRREPATAIILCNLPLPGLVPDKLASASDILDGGSRFERALTRKGFLTSNPWVLAACYPDLWPTPKAAEHDIRARYPETPDLLKESFIYADSGFLISAKFRIAPSRKWSRFIFDPERCSDPQALIAQSAGASISALEFRGSMEWQKFLEQQSQKAELKCLKGSKPISAPRRPVLIFVRRDEFVAWHKTRNASATILATASSIGGRV